MAISPTTSPAPAETPRARALVTADQVPDMMPKLPTTLSTTTALTSAQYESAKTHQQKAEDVIYTLNHAITCLGVTDLFVLAGIANTWKQISGKLPSWAHSHDDGGYSPVQWTMDHLTGKWRTKSSDPAEYRKPELHDHGHDHGHSHADHEHAHPAKTSLELTPHSSGKDVGKKAWHNMSGWIIGEAIGDIGAVPLTIATQRIFPGVMSKVRHLIEPVLSKKFHSTTQEAAVNWGKNNHYNEDAKEVVDRAEELYQYEMSHMPQMAVWTVLSVALNFAVVLGINKWGPPEYHHGMRDLMMEKLLGATITGGLVLGLRGLTPNGAHWWDQHVGQHVVLPVARLFGVNTSDAEAFQKKREMIEHAENHHYPNATLDQNIEKVIGEATPFKGGEPSSKVATPIANALRLKTEPQHSVSAA